MSADYTAETAAAMVTKAGPPISVSLATVAGYQVSELVLWITLIYTSLMVGHKLWSWSTEVVDRRKRLRIEQRIGLADKREVQIERRK